MNTQVAEKQNTDTVLPSERGEIAIFTPPRLPYHDAIKERYGVSRGGWKVLCEAIFPLARNPDSIILALAYCAERNLDVMKKPVHIVPMWNSSIINEDGTRGGYVDTIWPSIAELRTTAFRTGEYAGKDATEFGPMIEQTFEGKVQEWENRKKVWNDRTITARFPEWAQITLYRMVRGVRCAFVGPKVYWLEAYATIGKTDLPNDMWQTRSIGQIDKCAEAAALRCAFPEELGGMLTAEEMEGRRLINDAATAARDVTPERPAPTAGPPRRAPSHTAAEPPPHENGKEIEAEVTKPVTPSGPPRRAPDEKQESQWQASGEMPDPEDVQAFLIWAKGKLSTITDRDEVATVWTEEIEPNLTSGTFEEAQALYKKRLLKLG